SPATPRQSARHSGCRWSTPAGSLVSAVRLTIVASGAGTTPGFPRQRRSPWQPRPGVPSGRTGRFTRACSPLGGRAGGGCPLAGQPAPARPSPVPGRCRRGAAAPVGARRDTELALESADECDFGLVPELLGDLGDRAVSLSQAGRREV